MSVGLNADAVAAGRVQRVDVGREPRRGVVRGGVEVGQPHQVAPLHIVRVMVVCHRAVGPFVVRQVVEVRGRVRA